MTPRARVASLRGRKMASPTRGDFSWRRRRRRTTSIVRRVRFVSARTRKSEAGPARSWTLSRSRAPPTESKLEKCRCKSRENCACTHAHTEAAAEQLPRLQRASSTSGYHARARQKRMAEGTVGRTGGPCQGVGSGGGGWRKTTRSLKTTTRHSGPRKKDGMSLNDGPRDRPGK